jgi:hypothetical protein
VLRKEFSQVIALLSDRDRGAIRRYQGAIKRMAST